MSKRLRQMPASDAVRYQGAKNKEAVQLGKLNGYFCLAKENAGNDLLSQRVAPQVPSALKSLTSVFGMGTGVTSSLISPARLLRILFTDPLKIIKKSDLIMTTS